MLSRISLPCLLKNIKCRALPCTWNISFSREPHAYQQRENKVYTSKNSQNFCSCFCRIFRWGVPPCIYNRTLFPWLMYIYYSIIIPVSKKTYLRRKAVGRWKDFGRLQRPERVYSSPCFETSINIFIRIKIFKSLLEKFSHEKTRDYCFCQRRRASCYILVRDKRPTFSEFFPLRLSSSLHSRQRSNPTLPR